MAFDAELYSKAIELWEKMPKKEWPQEYHQAKCKVLEYPKNIIHFEPSGYPNWRSMVVDAYRADNGTHIIADAASRKILAKALFEVGNSDEQTESFTYLLSIANNISDAQMLLKEAIKKKISVAKECYEALFSYRWGSLETWNERKLNYQSESLNQLIRILAEIKNVKSLKFKRFLDESFKNSKIHVNDFMKAEFGNFARVIWNPLLFTEVGAIMEKRGHFLDAARYYEWVQRQTDDNELKKEMITRWIVCKERQAETSENAEEMLLEVANKRREINLSPIM